MYAPRAGGSLSITRCVGGAAHPASANNAAVVNKKLTDFTMHYPLYQMAIAECMTGFSVDPIALPPQFL